MMYEELYQYFIRHKHLQLPGIGAFHLERQPAVSDFPNRIIHPPSFSIAWEPSDANPSKHLFSWLAAVFQISERDAVIRFNDFVFGLKQMIRNGDRIDWDGMGILSSGLGGEIRFEPASKSEITGGPVKAEKVIREKAEHTVRVGEDERTSAQMLEYFNQPVTKRRYWWAWPLIVAVVVIMFLGWYFSQKGLQHSSSGNNQKLVPREAPPAYKSNPD